MTVGITNPWPPGWSQIQVCGWERALASWRDLDQTGTPVPPSTRLDGDWKGISGNLSRGGKGRKLPTDTPPPSLPSLLNESRKSLVWLNAAACSHLLLFKALSAHFAPTGSVSRPRHSISRHVGFGDPGQEDRDSVGAGGDPSELSCQPSSSPCVMHSDPHSLAASVRAPSHQRIPEGEQRLILAHPSKGLGSSFA